MKISTVGIEDLTFPVTVREKGGGSQRTVARIGLTATLPRQYRQSCLPAFIAILRRYRDNIETAVFPKILAEVKDELQARSAAIEMRFPYFIEKTAPVSGTVSLMEYDCAFACATEGALTVTVRVPTTTLCPCSKEISRFGAHNQRAEVSLSVIFDNFIWIEDLIALVESGASCEVYSLLKRPDEKYVTEKAYENPMFVEDVVRKVADLARAHNDITWFSVGVESFESIHKHSAYAYTDLDSI